MSDMPRPDSDEAWEQLLHGLRQLPAAPPQPFFYARVQARLQARASAPRFALPQWLRRPAYATLLGLLILAVSGDTVAAAQNSRFASHPAQPAPRLPR